MSMAMVESVCGGGGLTGFRHNLLSLCIHRERDSEMVGDSVCEVVVGD